MDRKTGKFSVGGNDNAAYKNAKYNIEYTIYKSTKTKTDTRYVDGKKVKVKLPVINNENDKVMKKGKVSVKANVNNKLLYNVGKKSKLGEWYYVKYRLSMKAGSETVYGEWRFCNDFYSTKEESFKVIINDEDYVNRY